MGRPVNANAEALRREVPVNDGDRPLVQAGKQPCNGADQAEHLELAEAMPRAELAGEGPPGDRLLDEVGTPSAAPIQDQHRDSRLAGERREDPRLAFEP